MEIIPKPAQKLPLWQNILFYFSLASLLAAVISYFIFANSLKKSENSLKGLEEVLSRERTSEMSKLEQGILSWQKKIKDFSGLFSKHLFPSKAFDYLGTITHPKVWFSKASLNSDEARLELAGEAENFLVFSQQLLVLKKDPQIKSFVPSSLKIGKKGKIDFSLTLYLDPQLLKK